MKKSLILLNSLFLLASCATPSTTSSFSAIVSSDSSLSSSPVAKTTTAAEVISDLQAAAAAPSLTVHYQEQNSSQEWVEFKDIYTSDYISYGWSRSGYVLLPSFDPSLGNKLVYSFQYDSKGNVVLGKAATYYDQNDRLRGVNTCDDMNFIKLFTTPSFALNASQFAEKGEYVSSEDEKIMTVFCSLMGYQYGDSDVRMTSIRFVVDEKGTLYFTLYHQTDEYSQNEEALLYGYFGEYGTSEKADLAAYIEDYHLPSEHLDETTVAALSSKTVAFDTTIRYASTNGWVNYGTISLASEYDANRPNDCKMTYVLNDLVNQERYTYFLTKDQDGYAVDHYVNGLNQVAEKRFKPSYFSWDSGIFSIQKELDSAGFLGENGVYRYYGFNFDRLYESITALSVLTDIQVRDVLSLECQVQNGVVTFVSNIDAYYSDAVGNETSLSIQTLSTLKTGVSLSLPSPFTEEDDASKAVQAAFTALETSNFVALGHPIKSDGTALSSIYNNTYYYQANRYFVADEMPRLTSVRKRYGYKVLDKGVLAFNVTRNGMDSNGKWNPGAAVASADFDTTNSLFSYLHFNASGLVFRAGSKANEYVLKDQVKTIAANLLGGPTKDELIDTSLVVTLDESGRLSKLFYRYVHGGILVGQEELVFTYYEAEKMPFPADIVTQESFDALDGTLPTSWLEESNANVIAMFKKVFGDEASSVPYLADQMVSNHWELGTNYFDSTRDFCVYNTSVTADYRNRFNEFLKEQGFVEQGIDNFMYYVKGSVKIRWGISNENQDLSTYLFFGKIKTAA